MPLTKLRPTFTFDKQRLAQLRAVVPEAFADGKINWETLHAALGEHLEDEDAGAEHFGLFWPGKRAARRLASTPSLQSGGGHRRAVGPCHSDLLRAPPQAPPGGGYALCTFAAVLFQAG